MDCTHEELDSAAAFDALRLQLDQALSKLRDADLDTKVAAYQEAVRLHADCLDRLQKVKTLVATSLPTPPAWPGFKLAKQEIEHMYTLVDTAPLLAEKVSAYRTLVALSAEYLRRLQEAQTLIARVPSPPVTPINKPEPR